MPLKRRRLLPPGSSSESRPSTTLRLKCLIEGETIVFPVTMVHDDEIGDLKELIQSKRALDTLKDVGPHTLELWKPKDSNPIAARPEASLAERIGLLGHDLTEFADKLEAADSVVSIFPTQPPRDRIHIIVKVPRFATISPSTSNESNASSDSSISDPPVISPNICLRKRTVEGLYDSMMKERLIYVRGTPGSGKSTLLDLLHQHILQKDTDAFVCVTPWPPQGLSLLGGESYSWLRASIPNFSARTSLTFLLIDEAQESFGDSYLWHIFFKNIIDKPSSYRVVVFCSYGSISTPGKDIPGGTPTDLKRAACMTLWPRKVGEGMEVNGLLLDWDEFNEVVSRFNKELAIDSDLSQKIFELTAGHVGAVCELLRLILDKMKTRIRRKGPLMLNTFYEKFSLDYIMHNLAGAFSRGLPNNTELSDHPDVSTVLRRLLVSGRVTGSSDKAAILYCHRRGWIYAEEALEPGPQSYTFATPLHHAALSWRLQARDVLPQFETPYALSLQVLAKFKPSQMKLPMRRVGGRSTDLPPEAQYQDEYYRSLLAVTCGNVRISPEFASARGAKVAGRIDFFIPGVKWGIEITREGDRLKNHASRFKADGAYGKWLKDGDMTDYVLLDCRTTTPRTSHPDIPNLYHVLFNESNTEVRVFNNKRDQVWGPITLQENHDNHTMLL